MLTLTTNAPALNAPEPVQSPKIQDSGQYRDVRIRGNGKAYTPSFSEFAATTWEFLFTRNNRTPDHSLPRVRVDLAQFKNPGENQLNITWLGHSSLMVNIDGFKILMDPVFQKRVSILGRRGLTGTCRLIGSSCLIWMRSSFPTTTTTTSTSIPSKDCRRKPDNSSFRSGWANGW